jgi:DNA-binding winged helix-turn-helix (wHTH) protein
MIEPDSATGAGRMLPSRYIRFGPFQVDQERQHVTKDGSRLRVRGKVYQILIALIEKQGEVISREELRLRLWPAENDRMNYDANVNTTVNKLRQLLGDSPDEPLYIQTVPRRGYCLLVPTELADCPASAAITSPTRDANVSKLLSANTGPRSDLWITVGIIALILAGMLLGAGIARLWIARSGQGSHHTLAVGFD